MIPDKSVAENFFGRENLLEFLYMTVLRARDGSAGSTLLSGRRGIGKTRFLANLYNLIFELQDDAAPFFYSAGGSLVSAKDFANDYLGGFIRQRLAFQEKDPAFLSGIYSLDDLSGAAKEAGADWAVAVMDEYIKVREEGSDTDAVLNALSAPLRSFQVTGMPVVVMIDDLHIISQFCGPEGGDIDPGFWMPFESSIRSMHVPHIFAGTPHEIEKVYFEGSVIADRLEMIDLPGLDEESSLRLFGALCDMYGLRVEMEPSDFLGVFNGNPLYIKNFLQAARQTGGVLSMDAFENAYNNEVTRGVTYRYWTSVLRKRVKRPEMRKPSLEFLHSLSKKNKPEAPDTLEVISSMLHDAGSVETGFSETVPADDVLRDVINNMYLKEAGLGSAGRTETPIAGRTSGPAKVTAPEKSIPDEGGAGSFIITVPADPKAGLVAIKSFEQIARNYNVPLEAMEKLQLAIADLFSNVLAGDPQAESFKLRVRSMDNMFSVEITTPQKDLELAEQDSARIGAYIDDLKVDSEGEGTLITLVKEAAPA